MNIAIILAGGNKRVEEHGVPVQFISLFEKPILVYTLEGIQKHPQIDAILVVCKPGWENAVSAYAKQFGISKLQWTTRGGDTVQESIRNGVNYLKELASEEDVIIIHDGNRPFINGDVLTDVIRVTQNEGNAITSTSYKEQMFYVDEQDESKTQSYINRDKIRSVTTPQGYRYSDLMEAYELAFKNGIAMDMMSYTDTMMVSLGKTLHFAAGSDQNIKLENAKAIELFKALITDHEEGWLK